MLKNAPMVSLFFQRSQNNTFEFLPLFRNSVAKFGHVILSCASHYLKTMFCLLLRKLVFLRLYCRWDWPIYLWSKMYFKGPRGGEIQNHSDLVLLFLHLQLQLHSAHCLRLTQQQPLGELETPHHLLKTNTLTLTLTRVNCVLFLSRWSSLYLLLLSCRYVLLH